MRRRAKLLIVFGVVWGGVGGGGVSYVQFLEECCPNKQLSLVLFLFYDFSLFHGLS